MAKSSRPPRRTESVLAGPRSLSTDTDDFQRPPPPLRQGTIKTNDSRNPKPDLTIYNFSHEPWRKEAECLGHPDPGIFFPAQERNTKAKDEGTAEAVALCRQCKVRWECLAWSIRQPNGIYGGFDEDERRKIKRTVQTMGRLGDEELAEAVVEEGLRIELFRLKGQKKRRKWK